MAIPFSLRQLAYFVAAAQQRNVTAAARLLNVSQPSISTAIAELEAIFGTILLFRRSGQGVHPTPVGQRLLAEARRLLALAADINDRAWILGDGDLKGEIRVGCSTNLAPFILGALLQEFCALAPATTVIPLEGDYDELRRMIEVGEIDLAISYDLGTWEGLERQRTATLAPHAMLPAGHALAAKAAISLAELAQEPFTLVALPRSEQRILALFTDRGLTPRIINRPRTFELQRALVAHGLGVGISFTRPVIDAAYDGARLVCRPLSDPVAPDPIVLVREGRVPLTSAGQIFWNYAADFLARTFDAEVMG